MKKSGGKAPVIVFFALVLVLANQTGGDTMHTTTLAAGSNDFALELYGKLKEAKGNIFFSPHSISTALAMTYAGARKDTASQMADVLHFTLDNQELHPAFGKLLDALNAIQVKGDIQLHAANSLWPQQGYPLLKEYLDLVKKHYGVTITPQDYKRAAEQARQTINRWVEEKTKERIKNLIQPGVLSALTRLVLVNAIYFKGNWASQFDEKGTRDDTFFLLSGQTVQTPMMTQEQEFDYGEHEHVQILELPYQGGDLSMLVFLPKEKQGLPDLEQNLTPDNLKRWTTNLKKRKMRVFLPKFKMTSEFRLDETLAAMGMGDAFDPNKADFSGMDGRPHWLFIGAVLHKAFVEVNEEGTEAAAATAVVFRITMAAPSPVFRADHPFIFLIRENKTNAILFLGRILDPSQ